MNIQNVAEFLEELATLTDKYGISISGCGCCGSPFLCEEKETGGIYEVSESNGGLTYYVPEG